MYELSVPIVMKSVSLNCLKRPGSPLARTTIALPLRFTLCRLQVQEPSKMYLARSRCRHNSNSTIDGYKGCSESADTFYRLQCLKVCTDHLPSWTALPGKKKNPRIPLEDENSRTRKILKSQNHNNYAYLQYVSTFSLILHYFQERTTKYQLLSPHL
jgi:hypothetical protein